MTQEERAEYLQDVANRSCRTYYDYGSMASFRSPLEMGLRFALNATYEPKTRRASGGSTALLSRWSAARLLIWLNCALILSSFASLFAVG